MPPDASFPAPPPTGCYGRRLRRAAVVGSVLMALLAAAVALECSGPWRSGPTRVQQSPAAYPRPR